MLPSAAEMHTRTDLYHGLFTWQAGTSGAPTVARRDSRPAHIPCPTTGQPLRIATLDAEASAICPRCATHGQGGFVSFVGDLRMAYACPKCLELVWLAGV
jgi:uncharacterized paraquat-inducible protein A